jgi:hypothetical protein
MDLAPASAPIAGPLNFTYTTNETIPGNDTTGIVDPAEVPAAAKCYFCGGRTYVVTDQSVLLRCCLLLFCIRASMLQHIIRPVPANNAQIKTFTSSSHVHA